MNNINNRVTIQNTDTNPVPTDIINDVTDPVLVGQVLDGQVKPAFMGIGLDMRVRSGLYPEISSSARSVHNQSNSITTTERSFGMPAGSGQDIYTRYSGTTGTILQISSSSSDDNGAGIGARTIYIEGIKISGGGNTWTESSTFSNPVTLTGNAAVQIDTNAQWYRINKIWCLTAGSNGNNVGDLYISPLGQGLSGGVPTGNILQAMIAGFGVSSGGYFSVASDRQFQFTFGNYWLDPTKQIIIHETFYQDFNGSGNTADMVKYEVGTYPSTTGHYSYEGAAPYTEKTDISLTVRTVNGTADNCVYYVEHVMMVASQTNR
jgi:hypothetical protein